MKLPFDTGFDLFWRQVHLSNLPGLEETLRHLEFVQEENKKGEKMLKEIQDRMFRAKKKYRQFELLAVGELVDYKLRLEKIIEGNTAYIEAAVALFPKA